MVALNDFVSYSLSSTGHSISCKPGTPLFTTSTFTFTFAWHPLHHPTSPKQCLQSQNWSILATLYKPRAPSPHMASIFLHLQQVVKMPSPAQPHLPTWRSTSHSTQFLPDPTRLQRNKARPSKTETNPEDKPKNRPKKRNQKPQKRHVPKAKWKAQTKDGAQTLGLERRKQMRVHKKEAKKKRRLERRLRGEGEASQCESVSVDEVDTGSWGVSTLVGELALGREERQSAELRTRRLEDAGDRKLRDASPSSRRFNVDSASGSPQLHNHLSRLPRSKAKRLASYPATPALVLENNDTDYSRPLCSTPLASRYRTRSALTFTRALQDAQSALCRATSMLENAHATLQRAHPRGDTTSTQDIDKQLGMTNALCFDLGMAEYALADMEEESRCNARARHVLGTAILERESKGVVALVQDFYAGMRKGGWACDEGVLSALAEWMA